MSKLSWIKLILALSLVMAFAVSSHISTSAAPTQSRPQMMALQQSQVAGSLCYLTNPELQSLHLVYLPGQVAPILETQSGPLGYDGGMYSLRWCR